MLAGRLVGSSVGSTILGSAQVRITVNGRSENPAARTRFSSFLTQSVIAWLRATCAARYCSTNSGEKGGPLRSSKMSRSECVATGSFSSTTEPSIHAVSTSGRPGCAALATYPSAGGSSVTPAAGRMPGRRRHVRVDGLRLVGRHQRPATGITQQHNRFHALDLTQPAHADADVHQCVVENEAALEPTEAGVPAEESDAAGGHVVGEIVLGEVDLVVRGDHRHLGFAPHPAVVEALARVATGAAALARWATADRRTHGSRPVSAMSGGLLAVDRPVEDVGQRR